MLRKTIPMLATTTCPTNLNLVNSTIQSSKLSWWVWPNMATSFPALDSHTRATLPSICPSLQPEWKTKMKVTSKYTAHNSIWRHLFSTTPHRLCPTLSNRIQLRQPKPRIRHLQKIKRRPCQTKKMTKKSNRRKKLPPLPKRYQISAIVSAREPWFKRASSKRLARPQLNQANCKELELFLRRLALWIRTSERRTRLSRVLKVEALPCAPQKSNKIPKWPPNR